MSFDPYAYEREEAVDARRGSAWPDDPDRPDPSEYEERAAYSPHLGDDWDSPPYLYLTRRLDCGHIVSAGEDSGGMDELPFVTRGDVQRLLDFKIKTHDCGRFEAAVKVRAEGRPFG